MTDLKQPLGKPQNNSLKWIGNSCLLENMAKLFVIFIEIFLPKTKPMKVGIVYWTPSQTRFLETMNEHFYEPDTINKEIYILGDFNINLY